MNDPQVDKLESDLKEIRGRASIAWAKGDIVLFTALNVVAKELQTKIDYLHGKQVKDRVIEIRKEYGY